MEKKILRYERKFKIYFFDTNQIENILRFSKLKFLKQHNDRLVNSIYFDDNVKSSFYDNVDGNSKKTKIRLRWYNNFKLIDNPSIEIKTKISLANYKKIYKIYKFKKKSFNKKNIFKIITNLRNKYSLLRGKLPVSSTHYLRKYFVSSNKDIRATIDTDINFRNLDNNFLINKKCNYKILEFKYHIKYDRIVRQEFKNATLRMTKNSKYVNSIIEVPHILN